MNWTSPNIAIVFDNTVRPETTGVYCRRALAELVDAGQLAVIEHVLPHELPHIEPGRFDLLIYIDDGLDYAFPDLGCPSAYWAIDTHLDFKRCSSKARKVNWTFSAQKRGAEELQAAGIRHASWLPLACDPLRHGRQDVPAAFDVSFVGNLFPGPRSELVGFIQKTYPRSFVGRKYFEEMARIYSASRIVFNRSLNNDLNMRVFEGLCSGSLLVTDELPDYGLPDLFQNEIHLATYRSREDLAGVIDYYLSHDAERNQIAAEGCKEVLARHIYRHRMETLMQQIQDWSVERHVSLPATSSGHDDPTPAPLPFHPQEVTAPLKSPGYFEWTRPEILDLIPPTAQRVLDVGCGAGRLGAALKARQPASVAGIELNEAAAKIAATHLDDVRVANIEDLDVEFPQGEFDCVVCADILEHLRHPESVLGRIQKWLKPEGCLVVSVPNVRNHTALRSLLAGNWTYESAGLLDDDHVRFFTRRELEKLFFRCGFGSPELRMVAGEGYDSWVQRGRPQQVSVGGLQVRASSPDDAAEFFAYQYLARSRPEPKRAWGLTSIILVTHNQWSFTQQCLDSIRLRTDEPFELIIVDNGSTDGTVASLKNWGGITVIANETNRGFPAAVNQGLAVARGENLLLLNNDTIVTTGWLRRMLETLHFSPEIGLVGPVSNRVSGEQQIDASYSQLSELDGFAWDWGRDHENEIVNTDRLVGFCLLIKRAAHQAIGSFDEQFGIGNFEDDDYCRRAIQASFQAVICRGAFVHHFGGATFRASGIDFQSLLETNHRKFVEKHEIKASPGVMPDPRLAWPALFPNDEAGQDRPRPCHLAESGTGAGLRLIPNRVKLSVCLIVRDNEHTIRPCLESIRPWVDEIVVVDTGSRDRTPAICEELGARLFHWEWRDDFAAARNVSLRHARGEWILWMDSDDTISEECGRLLRQLADGPHSDKVLGYVMQVHCPGTDRHSVTAVDHVKLIRNRPDLRFEFRIHEQILPSIRRAGGEVEFTPIHVIHSGADHSPQSRQRKIERDLRILKLELADRPDHPFVLFNLGMTYADIARHGQAVHFLRRCIEVSRPAESHLRKAFAILVSSLSSLHTPAAAEIACENGLKSFPGDKELLFRQAMLLHETGRLQQAAATYQQVLTETQESHFASRDVGIHGFKSRHNLALVYEDMGEFGLADMQWNHILRDVPDYVPAQIALQGGDRRHGHTPPPGKA